MSELTKYLPEESPVVSAIYAWHKQRGDAEPQRRYLGMSELGGPCERRLWYSFRHCFRPDFSGRLYRLFETGDLEEIRFIKELRAIGCTVHDVDSNGQQFAFSELGGHLSGHMDSAILGIPTADKTWHVGEYKTHNAKSFAKLKKEGVQKSKPQHYAQMQLYMGSSGMKRAIYLARNKDTDDLYAERIRYDKAFCEAMMERAERIITSHTPPERQFPRRDYFECNWCDANAICWGTAESALPIPSISCRQCCYATPTMDGCATWRCEKHKRGLGVSDQDRACEDHLVLPGLIIDAVPAEFGQSLDGHDFIAFERPDGTRWWHGRPAGAYATNELMVLPAMKLISEMVTAVKSTFNATVTDYSPDDILSRYPEEDSEIVWKGPMKKLAWEWRSRFGGEDIFKIRPIAKCNGLDYRAAEFDRDRVAIEWLKTGEAEIRRGKK